MTDRISVARDFSVTPGPRSRREGPYSGEEFLAVVLRPRFTAALAANEMIEVDLDGTAGYATSFLEAAFGGLSRDVGPESVLRTVKIISLEEPYLVDEIDRYIREARRR